MAKGIIKLALRKVIDAQTSGHWEQQVFADTYREYYLQAQQYDQQRQYATFQDMLRHVPRAADIHYLVSTAAVGYLRQLEEKLPNVYNTLGQRCVPFKHFRFDVLQSSMTDKNIHQVSITFYSNPLLWIDTIGTQLVWADATALPAWQRGEAIDTHQINLTPVLGIVSHQPINAQTP